MVESVFYVSRSLVPVIGARKEWMAIQSASLARNSLLGLTGILVATPDYFAQFIEGKKADIDTVMESIHADRRHTDIVQTRIAGANSKARFPEWKMACFPPGSVISRHLSPVIERDGGRISPTNAANLVDFVGSLYPDLSTMPCF
jgi:hypothetical protein